MMVLCNNYPIITLFVGIILFTDIHTTKGDNNGSEDNSTNVSHKDHGTNSFEDFIHKYNEYIENNEDENSLPKPELEIDRAWLTINSSVSYNIEIWAQSDECYKCDLMFIDKVPGQSTWTLVVNASFITALQLVRTHPGGTPKQILCKIHTKFQEKGDYWIFIDDEQDTTCDLLLANDPSLAEMPILYVAVGLILLAIVYAVGKRLFIYLRKVATHRRNGMDLNNQDMEGDGGMRFGNGTASKTFEETAGGSNTDEHKTRARLRSLDVFRGLTLTLMIFVNYGGGRYWFFEHATWNGIYVADLVFPWFVFIMGVSLSLSFRSMFKKEWKFSKILWKVFSRSAKLFILGFMSGTTHWIADLSHVRVFNVLQRLALIYFISSLIHFCFARRVDSHQEQKWAAFRDVILYIPEFVANLTILAIHLGVIYYLPVSGCPTGYTGPGGLSESGKYCNCTGGATQYVDEVILGQEHMYQWPTPKDMYQTIIPFDPEGILGTLGCVFMCFLGVQCGRIFLVYQDYKQRIARFLTWAIILGVLGALLTKCSQNDGWIPPNKNIWSLSYTLITGCFGYIMMTILYLVNDVFRVWQGQPFNYPGMNSIVIYLCHNIFYKTFPVSWEIEEIHWKLLLQCVWGTAVWVIVSYWLFVKKIFIAL